MDKYYNSIKIILNNTARDASLMAMVVVSNRIERFI